MSNYTKIDNRKRYWIVFLFVFLIAIALYVGLMFESQTDNSNIAQTNTALVINPTEIYRRQLLTATQIVAEATYRVETLTATMATHVTIIPISTFTPVSTPQSNTAPVFYVWAYRRFPEYAEPFIVDLQAVGLPAIEAYFLADGEVVMNTDHVEVDYGVARMDIALNLSFDELPEDDDDMSQLIANITLDVFSVLDSRPYGIHNGCLTIHFYDSSSNNPRDSISLNNNNQLSLISEQDLRGQQLVEALDSILCE